MRHKFLLFAFAALLFAGCEQPKPVDSVIAWVMSIKVTQIPADNDLTLVLYNTVNPQYNYTFKLEKTGTFDIPGAQRLDKEPYAVVVRKNGVDLFEPDTLPTFQQLRLQPYDYTTELHYVHYNENVTYHVKLRYD